MGLDQVMATEKTTPNEMEQIRVTGRGTTDSAISVGRVNSMYVVADAVCWLKFDNSSSAYTFVKSDAKTKEFRHPGGGASFPIIQELESTYLHCVADSGTVSIEIYPGGVSNL